MKSASKEIRTERVGVDREPAPSANRDLDYHAWLGAQAAALREQKDRRIDWDGIAEELEAMSRSEEDGLESFLKRLYRHLLKMGLSTVQNIR
jgi:hypothetical protein